MTEQETNHPTQGRRRRHKSPSSIPSAPPMPVPRLVDCLDTADGPSDEEGEKDAKRQRSEPTTPISTSSRPPHEYDEVMGITQVKPREADRFEEGIEPEFQDAEEVRTRETGEGLETGTRESGAFHRGFGIATLQECLDRINQSRTDAPATCHSGAKAEESPDPPQVMSPNVEEEQIHETTSVKRPSPDAESEPRIKEERKEEDVTPKSEAATVGSKDEPAELDSEDSLRPKQMGEELRRLIVEFPPSADSTPRQLDEQRRATAPCTPRELMVRMHQEGQHDLVVVQYPQTHFCFIKPFG